MDSKTLNTKIKELDGTERFNVKGLEGSGKCIPYIGWFWREVDFTSPISLGILPPQDSQFAKTDGWVGFMENNKWGYDEFTCTLPQSQRLEELLIEAIEKLSNETLQAVFNYMQTLRPSKKRRSK